MNVRLGICSTYSFLYGVHSFLEEARERGIKPIIGCTLTIGDSIKPAVYCFVENRQGFSLLCELLTLRNKDSEKFNPIPYLIENSFGLVLASSDENVLKSLKGRVKRSYAAITPFDIGAVGYGKKYNIPLAFLDNALFIEQDDFNVHRVLCAIRELKTIGNLANEDTAGKNRIIACFQK